MNKILLIFLLLVSFQLSAQNVLTSADEMPLFNGCDDISNKDDKEKCSNSKLIEFIHTHLVYPQEAREEGIEGSLYAQFVVTKTGSIENIKVLNFIGEGFEDEVIRVIKSMPPWTPGKNNGVAQNIQLRMPISFSLNKGKYNDSQKYTIIWGNLLEPTMTKKQLKNNFGKKLLIRDEFGNDRAISELIFSYEKGNKYYIAKSRGIIEKRLRKVVKKCKRGGIFTIKVIILDGASFKTIKKDYEII